MKPDQVLIVMDREEAKHIHAEAQCGMLLLELDAVESLRAALDRDPAELEARLAKVLYDEFPPDETPYGLENEGEYLRDQYQSQARSVLHALQEGTEK
jgi:hypothetical protein